METKQTGWLIVATFAISMLFFTGFLLVYEMPSEESRIFFTLLPAMLIPLLLFYRLVVVADQRQIKISFGIGLIRKSWQMADIESVRIVRNNLWHGWGIHYTLNSSVYNVSGFDAIELTFKGRKRRVRIGTKEPEKLAGFLNGILNKSR